MTKPNKEVKQVLIDAMVRHWQEDNPKLVEDIAELCTAIGMFNLKWGTRLNPTEILEELNN